MVDQNFLKAIWELFSMASLNFFHACVLLLANKAAFGLANQLPPVQTGLVLLQFFLSLTADLTAVTTGTATTAVGCLNTGGMEHGSLRLNVSCLPWDAVKVLPEAPRNLAAWITGTHKPLHHDKEMTLTLREIYCFPQF